MIQQVVTDVDPPVTPELATRLFLSGKIVAMVFPRRGPRQLAKLDINKPVYGFVRGHEYPAFIRERIQDAIADAAGGGHRVVVVDSLSELEQA